MSFPLSMMFFRIYPYPNPQQKSKIGCLEETAGHNGRAIMDIKIM